MGAPQAYFPTQEGRWVISWWLMTTIATPAGAAWFVQTRWILGQN